MIDNAEVSRSLIWSNRLVFFLGLWIIACTSAFPEVRGFLENGGMFDQGSGVILLNALTHEAFRYTALLAVVAIIAKEVWLLKHLRTRFKINVFALLVGIGITALFFFNLIYM